MLYLVSVPSLPKRVQQNAESESEAIATVFNGLPLRLKQSQTISDCSATLLVDPMDQFRSVPDPESEND